MRRLISIVAFVAVVLVSPALAQSNAQLGPLCTSEGTPADQQISACNKILALKVFTGEKLATIYFWRAVAYNKKGDYKNVIADTTQALKLTPKSIELLNMRGSAYYDSGEPDIAISDFTDALAIGPPSGTIYHNRGNAYRNKGDYKKALDDYTRAIDLGTRNSYTYQNRGLVKQTLGDLDGAMADINEAIRADPSLAGPHTARAVLWRAKGNIDKAIADCTEAVTLAKAKQPLNVMTPPGRVLINAYLQRGLSYEANGQFDLAKDDYNSTMQGIAVDNVSKANQATAKVRLSLLSDAPATAPVKKTETAGRRVALVIGNGAYRNFPALPNPPNDARAVAKSLRDLGYEVTEGIDLTQDKMQKMTREFMRNAAQAKTLVLYYAGHGVQISGRNFLVPIDVTPDAGAAVTDSMTDMDKILAGLDDQVRTNVLIFDACRNDPFSQAASAGGRGVEIKTRSGLAQPVAPSAGSTLGAGTLIAFATAPGQVALDGDGANSPFSAALTRHISTPGLEVQQMLTRVRAEVVAGTHNKQVPWSNSSLLGEVYLAAK
ncbi:MAG: caspase family protein [Rhizobiales bacterium]|nr:caspase family protein [Hyphomicrobiales bacterium]